MKRLLPLAIALLASCASQVDSHDRNPDQDRQLRLREITAVEATRLHASRPFKPVRVNRDGIQGDFLVRIAASAKDPGTRFTITTPDDKTFVGPPALEARYETSRLAAHAEPTEKPGSFRFLIPVAEWNSIEEPVRYYEHVFESRGAREWHYVGSEVSPLKP